jgi:hypothetical protein
MAKKKKPHFASKAKKRKYEAFKHIHICGRTKRKK